MLPRMLGEEYLPAVAPAQWRDKDEELHMPMEQAAYLAKPDYKAAKKDLSPSTARAMTTRCRGTAWAT